MKFTFQVTSSQAQAKNWIIAALKRNLTGESKADILNAYVESAQDLGMKPLRASCSICLGERLSFYLFEV